MTAVRPFCFAAADISSFFSFFAPPHLRGRLADRHKSLPCSMVNQVCLQTLSPDVMPSLGLIRTTKPCYRRENRAMPLQILTPWILQQVDNGTLCTLNTATLSTRTNLAPNPAQNTLNHVEVIQCHAFWVTEKPTRKFRKKSLSIYFENATVIRRPCLGNPANIRTNLTLKVKQNLWVIDLYFVANSVGLSSFKFSWCAPWNDFLHNSAFRQSKVIQGHWFWYQSNTRMQLSSTIIVTFGPILHGLRDIAGCCAHYPTPIPP